MKKHEYTTKRNRWRRVQSNVGMKTEEGKKARNEEEDRRRVCKQNMYGLIQLGIPEAAGRSAGTEYQMSRSAKQPPFRKTPTVCVKKPESWTSI